MKSHLVYVLVDATLEPREYATSEEDVWKKACGDSLSLYFLLKRSGNTAKPVRIYLSEEACEEQ